MFLVCDLPRNVRDYWRFRADKHQAAFGMSFSLAGCNEVKINEEKSTISINVDYGTDISDMVEHFALPEGIKAYIGDEELVSGVTSHDYTSPVRLSIVDGDGNKKEYIVGISYGRLPVVYIVTKDRKPITSREKYLDIDDVYVLNSDFDGNYAKAKIKGRGNSTWTMDKKSYTLKLDKKDKFLGMKKHKTFALVANHCDKTLLRNDFAYSLGRDLFDWMAWNPSTQNVYLVVNGEILGVYCASETNKIDANRIDIPNIEDCPSVDEVADFGFLLEFNKRMDEDFNFVTKQGLYLSLKEPDGKDIPDEYKAYIQNKVQDLENALYSDDFQSPESPNYYERWMDIPSFIDWYLVNEILKNCDAVLYASCYMYFDPKTGKFHMGPLWDFDISCGNINYNGCDNHMGWHVKHASWTTRLLSVPAIHAKMAQRYRQLRNDLDEYVNVVLKAKADELSDEAANNFVRWPILGKYIWPNADGYELRTTYQSEVDYMVDWLNARLGWMDSALDVFQDHIEVNPDCGTDSKCYNILGIPVDDSYKGIVICGERKIFRR